ncbi:hypothetical protein MBLNU230_g1670t1 [Neophaeotheca triangularis]
MCGSDIFLGILAVLFPPLAVWVKRGICSADSFINIALCVLGFLPGLIHAWYIIASYPEPTYSELPQQDPENGDGRTVTYYYVQQQDQPQYARAGPKPQGGRVGGGQRGYGTVNASASTQAPVQGSSSGEEVPPTYQQAVGDHKVQK